jgi:hypothetical protein
MEFPTLLYRVPGKHFGNYDYKGAPDEEAYEALKAAGWHDSIEEARSVGKVVDAAKEVVAASEELAEAVDDISPATRDELETKAKELGLGFNWKTSDEALAKRIADAL